MNTKRKIYILQMHSGTIAGKVIRFFTKYRYSHIAISLDRSCEILYSFGRKKLNSILDGGFIEKRKDGEFYRKFNKTECRIYEIEIEEEKYIKLCTILKKMKETPETYKYDYIGIILRFFYIPIVFKNRYVCTYFIAKILRMSKIYSFTKKDYFVVPKDFEEITSKVEIYSGMYSKYNERIGKDKDLF